jgi:tRNA(Ile)-lysidine synthase TilS/MesJ
MGVLVVSQVRKAIKDYDMIQDNDRIAIGVSGGKDSLTLLIVLAQLRGRIPQKFDIEAVTLDMGFKGFDMSYVQKLCDGLHVHYTIVDTQIGNIVFENRKETNPCSLCANLRRGILNDTAKNLGCNKVALGHNKDDVIETFIMSLFYEGRLHTFSPVTYLSRRDITVIRPLIYSFETDIRSFLQTKDITPVKSECPVAGKTNRQNAKEYIKREMAVNPNFKANLFGALTRGNISNWHEV